MLAGFPVLLPTVGSTGVTDAGRGPHEHPHRSPEAVGTRHVPACGPTGVGRRKLLPESTSDPPAGGEGHCANVHVCHNHTSAAVN